MQGNSDLDQTELFEKLIADSEPMLFMPYDVLREVRYQRPVKTTLRIYELDLAHLDSKKLLAHLKTEIVQLQHDSVKDSPKSGKPPSEFLIRNGSVDS